jgi:stress-induced-phosphoprotein 1
MISFCLFSVVAAMADSDSTLQRLTCLFQCVFLVVYQACYKQISNFDGVISDCTAVLEVEPDNVKALLRRAQAFEGVERYRFALQDVKAVLQLPYHQVGKTNFDLCNGMQHRLQRTVDQLKKMSS